MLEAYAAVPDAFTSTAEERANEPDAWWAQRIAGPPERGAAYGAFLSGDKLCGAVAVEYASKPKTAHKAHLIGMYVRSARRGRGFGRALVDAVLDHARQRPGTETITLTVTEGNDAAIALYAACGFVEFGQEPMAIRGADGFKTKVHMWRRVR